MSDGDHLHAVEAGASRDVKRLRASVPVYATSLGWPRINPAVCLEYRGELMTENSTS